MNTNAPKTIGLAVCLACLAFSTQASAANLLTNAGFESGSFAGWTLGGSNSGTGVGVDNTPIPNSFVRGSKVNVYSGLYAGYGLAAAGQGESIQLTQVLNIVASSTYTLGFYTGVDSNQPSFGFGNSSRINPSIIVNGNALSVNGLGQLDPRAGTGSNPFDMRYVFGTFTSGAFETTATVTYIITGSGSARAAWSFDNFEFNGAAVQAVPEPETYAMMLAGLGLLGVAARRRKHKETNAV